MSLTPSGQPAARTELVRAAGAGPTDSMEELLRGTCPACEVAIGEEHRDDCDVAECLATGMKRMWCRAHLEGHDCGRADWTGRWPAHRECREFGWHVRWDVEAKKFVRCSPDVEGSGPDLSRLYEHARWDQAARRWVRRRAVLFSRAVRGGRATIEELTKVARRWCAEQGYEVVGEHVGTRGWREAVADVADGVADTVVVPSVERLGFGKQVFERVDAVRAAGGRVAGHGVRVGADGRIVASTSTEHEEDSRGDR
ncbi:recombinase family protein [Micromonospora sp. RTP1Z1]|uniref:recombinase family protein n=1 Tax=Micromonospora sp. RTP1Z1 TaxID=2994043 RepID=UPI0029C8A09B|nr:recombinase family protein [Micromonospora sp. RTP1Z1]